MKKFFFVGISCMILLLVITVFIVIFLLKEKNPPFLRGEHVSQKIDHVVVIVMENESSSQIVNNPDASYINSLIHSYSFAGNYFAITHPSLPNYLALMGGDTFGITSDCTDCTVSSVSLIDQLESAHKTWKAYMESIPSACFLGSQDLYAQKHDPFMYFDNIRTNENRCNNIVPYTQLSSDLQQESTTPNFIWITPNMCDDMHDCSIAIGDTWLSKNVPMILRSPAFIKQKSLLVITWDEGDSSGANSVPTILAGDTVKNGYTSSVLYSHYSLLHTIDAIWGLPALTNNVAKSMVMSDSFKNF